ncbi:putative E3 ubiquitin-protein ligase HERC3 [Mustelus asterias]
MLHWGELGSQTRHKPASQTVDVLQGERIQHVCSRDTVTVFVSENGNVYTSVRVRKRKTEPGLFHHLKEQKIDFVDSGTSHILFLSKTGAVYQSEVKSKQSAAKTEEFSIIKPQLLKSLSGRNIIQVACGNYHSLALSKDGLLFAWGQNTYGQLGLGTQEASQSVPQSVTSLTGMPVAQITAGGEHSFALSLSGAVFGWGRNNHGQLGLKNTDDRYEPNHVKLLECKKTIHISCGEEHTAVLTKDGFVYTFGAGSYGQLGHNSTKDEIKPHFVGYLFGNKVSQIACGSHHTLVFVPTSGKIYSFGRGENGQLGNGEMRDQLVPHPVNMEDTSGNSGTENDHTTKPAVRRIFAGGNQSFAEYSDEVELVSSINQSSLNTSKCIMTVDNLLEKKFDKNTRKAIVRAFSSSQTLSGSFLDVSKDRHFKTNGEMSGVDTSAVYLGFVKLAKNSSILQQVKNAVQNSLIPSLPRSPACVETMRVYIILPELIAVLEDPRDSAMLTDSLSKAILSLEESDFKILECWWSTMPYYFFIRLVRMFQKESHRHLQLAMADISKYNSQLRNSLKLLQTLYQVNASRYQKIPERYFRIPVMDIFKASLTVYAAQCFPGVPQTATDEFINSAMKGHYMPLDAPYQRFEEYFSILRKILENLIPSHCIFDLETKLEFWTMESLIFHQQAFISQPILSLHVSRKSILQDALDCLRSNGSGAQYAIFQTTFKDELSFGSGVSQEFFTLFSRELLNNGRIFQCSEDSGLLWFPTWEPEMDDVFHLVGVLCRYAVSNRFICNFHFPLALYKKLLHVQPTLEDLKELSPTAGNSLQEVLDYEYDDVEDEFCLDFTIPMKTADGNIVIKELIPDGNKTPVQKHNRKQFVDAYVDYKLNTSVEQHFEAFSQGFRSSFSLPVVDVFHPEELRDVIHGNTNYEWELLEQNAYYEGYVQTDKTIRNFWKVFANLEEVKKKRFLAFLTGSDRFPVKAIGNLRIIIFNTQTSKPDSSYPSVSTCKWILYLPNYSNMEILREKLLHAMEYGEEFNIMLD